MIFFICTRPFDEIKWSAFIYFFICVRTFNLKLGSSLICFFHLHTTIRQKYTIFFHLFFLCARSFLEKLGSSLIYFFCLYTAIQPKLGRGHSYSLIYSFLNCANISFAIFMAVLHLYFVRFISGSTTFIFRPL